MRLEYRRFNYCDTSSGGRTSHFSEIRHSLLRLKRAEWRNQTQYRTAR